MMKMMKMMMMMITIPHEMKIFVSFESEAKPGGSFHHSRTENQGLTPTINPTHTSRLVPMAGHGGGLIL